MAIAHLQGRRIEVRGTVQGVGFRPWVYRVARQAHVTGRVLNHAAGVTIYAFGTPEELEDFCAALRVDPPPAARIQQLEWADIPSEQPAGFTIVASRDGLERVVSIPADLATCPACTGEIFDPSNRRYRYPFTNCTDCLRPAPHIDGLVRDVRRLPAGVRRPGGSAVSRAAERLSDLRPASDGRRRSGRAVAGSRSNRAGRARD
jgi:acylphosphatase